MQIDVWSDINCPYCYLGHAQLAQALAEFEHADQVEIRHRSYELAPELPPEHSEPVVGVVSRNYGMSRAQAVALEHGIAAKAHGLGLGYSAPDRDMGSTFDMHRLVHWADRQGRQDDLLHALFKANFADPEPFFGNRERLLGAVQDAGLDVAAAAEVLDDPTAFAAEVRDDEKAAREVGIDSIPYFLIDGKHAVSGARGPETFARALERAWADESR